MKRIQSIDIVRGLVMVLMALDHVRDLMHVDSISQSPTDLSVTTPYLFFTRWITHLCAPIFVFLAGTSVYFSVQQAGDIQASKKHLRKRGIWLIILEFSIVNFALFFDVGFHTFLFEVIASTGFGFIILSLLLTFSANFTGLLGLIIILAHNLLLLLPIAEHLAINTLLMPFFNLSAFPLFADKMLVVAYPPIPWLGIMLLGYSMARIFEWEPEKSKKMFSRIGLGMLVIFVLIRYWNAYGDPLPWSLQMKQGFTFLSFLNISKYPPSLLFCFITLGIMFFILALVENLPEGLKKFLRVYGRVPLFYFVIHFYLIHILTLLMLFLQGFPWHLFSFSKGTFGRPLGVESGLSLWAVYLVWVFVVLLLYKPCEWFGRYKMMHPKWWLRYF
ncbi:MAG: hypothetical protein RJA76_2187 [Bacteroidota bacterium]